MGDLLKTPWSEVNATWEVLAHLGVREVHLKRIRTDNWYAKRVADYMVHGEALAVIYLTPIDYGLTLEEMISEGKYDEVDSEITREHFPFEQRRADTLVFLLHYFVHETAHDVIPFELDRMGLRPATLPELLAFGAKYPEIQRQYMVIALGSRGQGPDNVREHVPILCGDSHERILRLWQLEDVGLDWHHMFLVVKK